MTATAKLETLDKDLAYIARMVCQMHTTDYDTADAVLKLIRDMRADLEGVRLELLPDAEPLAA